MTLRLKPQTTPRRPSLRPQSIRPPPLPVAPSGSSITRQRSMMLEEDKYRKLVDTLHHEGVGAYLKLPQIAVMGDTSSGKSSLLSQLSGIEFPSNHAITTKCPTRLHMTRARNEESFYAKVSITWHKSSSTYQIPFEPRVLDCIGLISNAIADAQAHIIAASKQEINSDVVEVELSSPDHIDLTLIDLPGIVRTSGIGESASMKEKILLLMQEYLQNERCIILAVNPANVDFHNSQIFDEALKVDPHTQRTIAVITKPDLIDRGAEQSVVELLLGERISFKLGLHMVKCRSQLDLDHSVTLDASIQKENLFFLSEKPWADVEDRSLFGTLELREKLAKLQIEILKASVPDIRNEISAKRKEAERKLDQLGSDTSEAQQRREIFLDCVLSINKVVCNHIENADGTWRDTDGASFQSVIQKHIRAFNSAILASKLARFGEKEVGSTVRVYVDGVPYKGIILTIEGDSCSIDLQNSAITVSYKDAALIKPGFLYDFRTFSTSFKGKGVLDSVAAGELFFNQIKLRDIPLDSLMSIVDDFLMKQILKNSSGELPIFPSPQVFKKLVENHVVNEWANSVETLVSEISTLVYSFMEWALKTNVPTNVPDLLSFLSHVSNNFLEKRISVLRAEVQDLIRNEQKPLTQNNYLIENVHKMRLASLRNLLKSIGPSNNMIDKRIIEGFIDQHHGTSNEAYLAEEMRIALSAYGKVAAKRFIDITEQAIKLKGTAPLCAIFLDLKSTSDVQLEAIMKEKSGVTAERKRCMDIIDKMKKASKALESLMGTI